MTKTPTKNKLTRAQLRYNARQSEVITLCTANGLVTMTREQEDLSMLPPNNYVKRIKTGKDVERDIKQPKDDIVKSPKNTSKTKTKSKSTSSSK